MDFLLTELHRVGIDSPEQIRLVAQLIMIGMLDKSVLSSAQELGPMEDSKIEMVRQQVFGGR
jgi:hypothetical protein